MSGSNKKQKQKYTLPIKKIKINPSRLVKKASPSRVVKRISPSRVKKSSPSRKIRPRSAIRMFKKFDEENLMEPSKDRPTPISPPKRISSTPPNMARSRSSNFVPDNISRSARVSKVDFESNKILEKIQKLKNDFRASDMQPGWFSKKLKITASQKSSGSRPGSAISDKFKTAPPKIGANRPPLNRHLIPRSSAPYNFQSSRKTLDYPVRSNSVTLIKPKDKPIINLKIQYVKMIPSKDRKLLKRSNSGLGRIGKSFNQDLLNLKTVEG
jgi:hypothetical protein